MLTRFFPRRRAIVVVICCLVTAEPVSAGGGGALTGGATEWTQILSNTELVGLVGQSAQQINNQITPLAQQIQNQLRIYENMLQNTAQLPAHIWGQVENDLNRLRNIVGQGQGIAFSMGECGLQRLNVGARNRLPPAGTRTVAAMLVRDLFVDCTDRRSGQCHHRHWWELARV